MKGVFFKYCVVLSFVFVTCFSMGCSKSSSAVSSLKAALASVVVTSPTASSSTSLAFSRYKWLNYMFPFSVAETTTAPPDVKPMGTMQTEFEDKFKGDDPTAMAAQIGTMEATTYRALCYGPVLTDNATGANVNRPLGDLGMWASTGNPSSAESCAAAELAALIGGAPQFVNKLRNLQATLIIAMGKNGRALPDVGAEVDGLSDLPTISGMTISSAKLKRLSDRGGFKVYKTSITFSKSAALSDVAQNGTVTIYHSPKNDDNSNFIGLIQAVLPYNNSFHRGLSMVYEQTDKVLTYALDTAANRNQDSQDFFNATSGRVDFSKAAFGEDGNRIIASFNDNTNGSTMHYAWQAGSGDGAVRAFALEIPAGTKGSLTGVAYFGFGDAMSSLTDNVSTAWPKKMYCNWVLGTSTGATVAEVQGQTFTENASGVFIPATNKINFAPTNTCAKSGTYIVSAAAPTDYNDAARSGTKDLTTPGTLGAVSAVTVPSYPIPTE